MEQLKRLRYGELTITIVIHDGQVREVQRTITEKTREEK